VTEIATVEQVSLLVIIWRSLILRCIVAVLMLLTVTIRPTGWEAAQAQDPSGEVIWSEPSNLSNTVTSSAYPAIATDPYGNVHVFWSEDLDGEPKEGDEGAWAGPAIYYIRWDGYSWSSAIDVQFKPNSKLSFPATVADNKGILHLIWCNIEGIGYSQSPVLSATNARAWSPPTILAQARSDDPCLIADRTGGLHIAYAQFYEGPDGYKDGNVYYIHSTDQGHTWSEPVKLSEVMESSETLAMVPRLAVDGAGRLHAVWHLASPPNWMGDQLQYARSLDGGLTWSRPREVDSTMDSHKGSVSTGNVAAIGNDEIHLVWISGEQLTYRRHQWSLDGGQTWTSPQPLFGALHSWVGRDAVAVDIQEDLYWIMELRYPFAMYYSHWNGSGWSDPPMPFITTDPMASGHYPAAAVSNGNELHLVVQSQPGGEIYYARGYTSATHVPPLPTPKQTVTRDVTPTAIAGAATRESRSGVLHTKTPSASHQVFRQMSPSWPIFAGLVPVSLLVGIIIFIRARRT